MLQSPEMEIGRRESLALFIWLTAILLWCFHLPVLVGCCDRRKMKEKDKKRRFHPKQYANLDGPTGKLNINNHQQETIRENVSLKPISGNNSSPLGYKERTESAVRVDNETKKESSKEPHYANLPFEPPSSVKNQKDPKSSKKSIKSAKKKKLTAESFKEEDDKKISGKKTSESLKNRPAEGLKMAQKATEPVLIVAARLNKSDPGLLNKRSPLAAVKQIQSPSAFDVPPTPMVPISSDGGMSDINKEDNKALASSGGQTLVSAEEKTQTQ